MDNGRIRFGKQSGGEVVLVFPDGVDNTEVFLPESGGGLATKDYVDATLVGLGGLSVSDKTKLDGIEEEATKNETDAFLLDRSNHTGTIPMSVVENLEQELANISTGGSGGLTPDELLRIEELESGIVKKADLDSEGKILTSQLPVIPTSLPDADSDGKLYGRKDGTWTEIVNTGGEVNLTYYYTKSETDLLVATKQDTLVSGTNIKTINGLSVLGSGDIFVTAETDLSNYYTKPQVDGFINDINAELGSMVILGEYGLRWNQETDVYEALGSVNRRQIQGNMKRCVLNDDGTVNYYLHPTNSTLKANGTLAVLTGADGNVMVEVPKFWYKHTLVGDTHEWWVSNTPLEGYSVHPWFLEGGVERPFRYYRAYTPTVVAGKLRSISGSTPTRSQTRNTFRTQARANGTGWELCSWNAVNAIQLLFLTEYCTFNTQAVLGRGNDVGGDSGITTGQSNSIGNASSIATNNDMQMSYRGIENWYADCWEFIDGINIQNYKVFLNQNPITFADDVFTGDYVDSGITLPAMSASYIKKITGNFLPTAVGGSSSTFVTDAGWSNPTGTLVGFGGDANSDTLCGGFTFYANGSSGLSGVSISAGLSR